MSAQDESAALERQFEEDARRRRRTTRLVFYGFVGLMILPFAWYALNLWLRAREEAAAKAAAQLTPAEISEANELMTQGERALAEAAAEFRNNMTPEAMKQALERTPAEGPECPYALRPPTPGAAQSYIMYGSIDGNYFGTIDYSLRSASDPIGDSREITSRQYWLRSIGEKLKSGRAEKRDLRELRGMTQMRGASIILVAQTQTASSVSGFGPGVVYKAGSVTGAAYIYSFTAKRIACAGAIVAENSPKLDFRFSHMKDNYLDETTKRSQSAEKALERDLEVQIRRTIATSMRAVPPPAP